MLCEALALHIKWHVPKKSPYKVTHIGRGCIINTDVGKSKEKAFNRSGNFIRGTGDYRYFYPDFTYNPVSITRRFLLYAEL